MKLLAIIIPFTKAKKINSYNACVLSLQKDIFLKKMLDKIKENLEIFVLIGVFAIIIFFISPFFEFPLNDDWSYANAVRYLINNFQLIRDPFISANVIFQILWGGLFCKLFGFSFTVLRISTLVLSVVCIIVFYLLLNELGFGKSKSLLGSLVLLLNPIYIHLTYSFMSDIHYLCFFFLAILFFLKAVKLDSLKYLILAEIITVVSFMIRQNGIFIYLGTLVYFILMIIKKEELKILKGIRFWIIMLIPLMVMLIFFWWRFNGIYNITPLNGFWGGDVLQKTTFIFIIFSYLACFMAPILVGYVFNSNFIKINRLYCNLVCVIYIINSFVAYFIFDVFFLMPYLRSTIHYSGVGCIINIAGFRYPFLSVKWFLILTSFSSFFVSVIMAAIILNIYNRYTRINANISKKGINPVNVIYIIGIVDFISILVLNRRALFDRYLLPLILPAIVFVFDFYRHEKISKIWVIIFLFIMGFFSIKGTKDCIAWNNARWQAGNYLLSRNVSIDEIDGGYEWNGWNFFNKKDENVNALWNKGGYNEILYPKNSTYVISFSDIDGYEIFEKIKYRAYLGEKYQFIYILKKQAYKDNDTGVVLDET